MGDCQAGVVAVLRRALRGRWAAMSVAVAAAALASAAVLVQPLVAGRAVDEASHGGVSWGVLSLLAAAFVVAILAEAADTYLFYRLGEEVVFDRRRVYATHLMAMPVVDKEYHMKGIVTVDDIVDVVREEATTDIQKLGGSAVLDAPYLKIGFFDMLRKRAGWLTSLFVGEMLTATAMTYYEGEIARAVVLALFIPLIISSGGNSGSQASTLIIRAIALGEARLRDWWRVLFREIFSGLALGVILGLIGMMRILFWPGKEKIYGEHYFLVSLTVACSLVGVVLWGATTGAMLPFILKRVGFDPATASAPFVATLVDVTGLIIYFSIASQILSGTLL